MDRKTLNRAGLAAAVLLVPGGLLLGAGLLAWRHRQRVAKIGADAVKADLE